MRNLAIVAALLAAMPLAAQEPTPTPAPAPTLEKPGMAPATEEQKPVAKPKVPAAPAKANSDSGKVVEEIIARVNNEIITRSEYDKALATADEEVRQDCGAKCTPEQLQAALEDRKNGVRHRPRRNFTGGKRDDVPTQLAVVDVHRSVERQRFEIAE